MTRAALLQVMSEKAREHTSAKITDCLFVCLLEALASKATGLTTSSREP
jgi:hypothetical protein